MNEAGGPDTAGSDGGCVGKGCANPAGPGPSRR